MTNVRFTRAPVDFIYIASVMKDAEHDLYQRLMAYTLK
jgi:hypothetical protein